MTRPSATDTLLVFTLGPARERRRRRLLPAGRGDAELALHRQGLDAALEAGRRCGCRLRVSSPERPALPADTTFRRQRGGCFGERLRDAVRGARHEEASGCLVVVGTDTPGLAARHVDRALEHLRRDRRGAVVGPSPDGGFYLLASRQPLDGILARVRWRRRDTLKSLLAALRAAGRPVHLLPALRDLDRRSDLERLLAAAGEIAGAWRPLLRILRALLAELRRPFPPPEPDPLRPALLPLRAGRGPPR